MARIAVDAMGGDFAPRAPIAGSLHALAELGAEHEIELIGRSAEIAATIQTLIDGELSSLASVRHRLHTVDAADIIEMADKPSAIRGKAGSSMAIGLRRVAEGHAQAFVSAGNTGAQMVGSLLYLKLHEGLKRPAIGTLFPTAGKPVLVLDSGANVDCSPHELVQFARIGAVYAHALMGRDNPVIGLLSIGEEAEKGNAVVKEAHQLLLHAGLNFVGNIEGRDIPNGACDRGPIDVVVCDGFTGNILLKFMESVSPLLINMTARAAGAEASQLRGALKELDADEYGGAPLLGVRGVSIISHGKSSPRALKNAVHVAVRAVESGMTEEIGRRLAESLPQALSTPNGSIA